MRAGKRRKGGLLLSVLQRPLRARAVSGLGHETAPSWPLMPFSVARSSCWFLASASLLDTKDHLIAQWDGRYFCT